MKSLIYFFCLYAISGQAQPSRVINLSTAPTNGGVILTWTAPTPSGVATLTSLDVRYDTSPINVLNWSSKPQLTWLTSPGAPGTLQTATVTSLTPNVTYYFALKTQDSSGSWSTMSNVPLTVTGGATYSIRLGWTASATSDVTNYNVYVGTASGTYNVATNSVGNVTSCTVTGLTYGVTYYFAATSEDILREGSLSGEISYHRP